MTLFGLLSFGEPLLLWALATLPAIWWLLRFTPPRPAQTLFPPLRLILGLRSDEKTPVTSPWWLTALRVCLAGLVILALAAPILRPRPALPSSMGGPLVLIIDNGWAAGDAWTERLAAAQDEIARAAARDEPVMLVATAIAGPADNLAPLDAQQVSARLAGLVPQPFPPDRPGVLARLKEALGPRTDARIVWLSDGLDHGHGRAALDALTALGQSGGVSVYMPDTTAGPLALGEPRHDGAQLTIPVKRASPGAPVSGRVMALALNGRSLGDVPFALGADEVEIRSRFDMPLELRNEIARVVIADQRSAGAVRLFDDRWRRRHVGLITGESRDIAQPLLSPLYYVERALAPFAELRADSGRNLAESIEGLLKARVGLIVMTDIGRIADTSRDALAQWVENGGILVRFAGPHLAGGADDLVPVRLREGGRTLGGTLSWSKPQPLGAFDAKSPFAELAVPREVTVLRQVLAEPDIELAEKTWAQLADGTPLVTAAKRGRGWLILFHVTANPSWSNLPLSGLFVTMMQRISELAPASGVDAAPQAAPAPNAAVTADLALPPMRTLDGRGELVSPPATARPIAAAAAERTVASADHPPGFYGQAESFRAINVLARNATLRPLSGLPEAFAQRSYARTEPMPLKPWLLLGALVLLLIDAVAVLALSGLRLRTQEAAGAALVAACLLLVPPPSAHSQTAGASPNAAETANAFALKATLQTRLAYVITGNADIDAASETGLRGLSQALAMRTALEPGEPIGVDISRDELAFFPMIYWPIDPNAAQPDAATLARVDAFMKQGGTILFDTRDEVAGATGFGPRQGGPGMQALRRMLAHVDLPALETVPADHVLTKAFYLLQDFPGRFEGGQLWVEATQVDESDAPRPARNSDGVSSILITSNDLAAAWAIDERGEPLYPVVPGGERQREMAYRTGINIVMYALTGNYKADQVHVPALLERLGQ